MNLMGCVSAQSESDIGMTLLFLDKGPYPVLVKRFDPDGVAGPTPGWLGAGPTDGKQMSFMPADSRTGMPKFVDIAWSEVPPEAEAAVSKVPKLKSIQPAAERADIKQALERAYALYRPHTRRIDLTSIITPALLAQIRANRSTTNLQMTVIFKDGDVTLIAEPEVWNRKLRFSSTDSSPAAMDELRAANIAARAQYERMFFAHGYYVGQVSGAQKGTLTMSVRVDGTGSAVIASVDQPAMLLHGVFDTASNDAVRTLKLIGNSVQGNTTMTGLIDLKARTLKGEWTTVPTTSNSSSLSGNFAATR
jgi:hypothetical protein